MLEFILIILWKYFIKYIIVVIIIIVYCNICILIGSVIKIKNVNDWNKKVNVEIIGCK